MDPEANYTVSYDPDQGSMQFLYDLTDIFLRPVIKDDFLPDSFFDCCSYNDIWDWVADGFGIGSLAEIFQDTLEKNKQFLVILAFGVFFSVVR